VEEVRPREPMKPLRRYFSICPDCGAQSCEESKAMRSLICAFGVSLVFAALPTSARCDDLDSGKWLVSPTNVEEAPVAPPAPAPSATAAPSAPAAVPCEGLVQMPAPAASPFDGPCCERPVLLGSICGVRDQLGAKGISISADTYQYYQGVATGGINDVFRYGGRNDYFINVDGEKAGLWKGLFITLHGETRYGESVNFDTGAIMPVNTGELFPKAVGTETALTGVKFTQALSENFVTFAGKLNMLDQFKMPFTGTSVLDGFSNLGLAFPVAVARTVPYSTLGAGMAVLQKGQPVFTLMVIDTNNTPTTTGFESFFNNGATIIANATLPVTWCGLPGHQSVWGTFSTGKYSDLQPTAYFDPNEGLVVTTGTDRDSWSIFYTADQALWVDPSNPAHAYGVYTNIGTADNGPSPIHFAANVALYGSSPITSRPLDTFGVGYTFTRYSSPVRDLAPVLLPIGNDQAIELFYNVGVTPWFHVTPDLQVVFPAREDTIPPNRQSIDTALVLGLRAKIDF
jgi:porin